MANSIAMRTLERAQFFLEQAESSGLSDRLSFEHFLEAAIVFGRSVTFHLQKEFSVRTGFDEWYAEKQTQMKSDQLFIFFKEKRNYILKEGPVPVPKTKTIAITDSITTSDFVQVRVKRAKPWCRRSPKSWLKDIRAAIARPLRRWCCERQQARRRKQYQRLTHAEIQEQLHFEEPEWQDRAATDVLREYLLMLECLVGDAESRFVKAEDS